MFTRIPATLVAVLVMSMFPGAVAPASEPEGVIFDVDRFEGAVPDGFKPSSDFDPCEFKRTSRDGRHLQQIYSGGNDRCPSDDKTNGAPGFGDVSIYRSYDAGPDEVYKGWARGYMFAPVDARATVKIIFFDLEPRRKGIAECWGRTESTESQVMHTGAFRKGLNGRPRPTITESGGCKAPGDTDGVSIHYRIHAIGSGASGKAVLERLQFGRCQDNGDCSNVPGF